MVVARKEPEMDVNHHRGIDHGKTLRPLELLLRHESLEVAHTVDILLVGRRLDRSHLQVAEARIVDLASVPSSYPLVEPLLAFANGVFPTKARSSRKFRLKAFVWRHRRVVSAFYQPRRGSGQAQGRALEARTARQDRVRICLEQALAKPHSGWATASKWRTLEMLHRWDWPLSKSSVS